MRVVAFACFALASVAASGTLRGRANPDKPVEAFSREPLPPGQLLGSVAHDTHRNFPYDAFSTTFKCDKGPCPGSKQTGCGCAKCPCEAPKPPPCANPTPCGCGTPCVKPMPVAGPSTKTVGPKTGGNGNEVKPVMVPHGKLPDKFEPTPPTSSLVELGAKCPDCCPKPCSPTCTCGDLKPMPVAGPSTKTVSPKTGGNGDEVKPVMVPHGKLPDKFEPVKPCGGPAPCAVAQKTSFLEELGARKDEPFKMTVNAESVTVGDAPQPGKGETLTKTKPTGDGSWHQPHMVRKGDMESYLRTGRSAPREEHQVSQQVPEQVSASAGTQRIETAEAREERDRAEYHARVDEATRKVVEAKDETITNFVPRLGGK